MSALQQWLQQLNPGSTGQQLLAVHNGYCLWLGLVQLNDKTPVLLASGTSTAIDAVEAISAARQKLIQQYSHHLPRQVTFISTSILPALLDLPLKGDKARKAAEMEQMISWELETQVADNNDLYILGSILVGRGLITQQQRELTSQELERRRQEGAGLCRYGEVAIELGFISPEQLQESLLLQEKLIVTDARLACGWQVQTMVSEDRTEYQWFTAGIDARVRRQWFNAFTQNNLTPKAIFPHLGSSAPLAALKSEHGNVVVIEAHQDNVVVYRLERSQFASFQQQPRQHHQNLAEQCYGIVVEELRSNTELVLLVDIARTTSPDSASTSTMEGGHHENNNQRNLVTVSNDDLDELSKRLQYTVQWLLPEAGKSGQALPDTVLAAFYGVALASHKHVVFSAEDSSVQLVNIEAIEAAPPLWKSKELYRYGMPVVLLVAIIAHGAYTLNKQTQLQERLDSLDVEFEEQISLNQQISVISSEYQRQESELLALQQQAENATVAFEQLNQRVMARTQMVPRLLKAISQSVIDSVMLDSIIEPRQSRNSFNITAWAMNNSSASQFIERLQQLVGRLGYRVVDPDIRTGISRHGLNGYTLELWLIPENAEASISLNVNNNPAGTRP